MSRMLDSQASEPVLRRLATDRSGVTAIVTGIGLTMLLGFAGAAIDVAYWLNSMRGMQSAADQAAFSAAVAAGSTGCSGTAYSQQARAVAAARGYIDGQGATVTVTCRASDGELAMEPPQKVRADGKSQNCAGNRLDGPAHAGGAGRPTDRVTAGTIGLKPPYVGSVADLNLRRQSCPSRAAAAGSIAGIEQEIASAQSHSVSAIARNEIAQGAHGSGSGRAAQSNRRSGLWRRGRHSEG